MFRLLANDYPGVGCQIIITGFDGALDCLERLQAYAAAEPQNNRKLDYILKVICAESTDRFTCDDPHKRQGYMKLCCPYKGKMSGFMVSFIDGNPIYKCIHCVPNAKIGDGCPGNPDRTDPCKICHTNCPPPHKERVQKND